MIKSMKQILRQPMKSLAGIILITLAVAVLCVCLGQSIAATQTEESLNKTFQTVVFPSPEYSFGADEWALNYAASNSNVIKAVSNPGLASAYIKNLLPDNYVSHFDSSDVWEYITEPYNHAILEITLDEIGKPTPVSATKPGSWQSYESEFGDISVQLIGTVNRVIMLQEDYQDCTNFIARLTLELPSTEDFEKMNLTIGERYLVYCTDFQDSDYQLRAGLCRSLDIDLANWDRYQDIEFFTEEELQSHNVAGSFYKKVGRIRIGDRITYIYDYQVPMYMSVSGTLCNQYAMPQYQFVQNEAGAYVQEKLEPVDERYMQPTIAHLSGTAEEFLESADGILWRETMQNIEINNHAFPVIGVDRLDYLADFSRRVANIVEGRDFTEDELNGGTRVCIISDTVAEKNGLGVGDTLDLQYYDIDEKLYYQQKKSGSLSANPTACFYYNQTTPLYDTQEYIIVGIYDRGVDWVATGENIYAFTPNTIFVPKASVTSEMEYRNRGFFRTFVLKNGCMDEFLAEADSNGFSGMFVSYDNGYSDIAKTLEAYQLIAKRALLIGSTTYGIILILFLFLFPMQQAKNLITMESLGAPRGKRIAHVIWGAVGILVPSTFTGLVAGILIWQYVVDALTRDMAISLSLQMDIWALAIIGCVQLVFSTVIVFFIGVLMNREKSLMKRK